MTSAASECVFHINVNGIDRQYVVGPVYAQDGRLRQVSIRYTPSDREDGQVIDLDLDPNLFSQFALPSVTTMFRIAISQANSEGLFGDTSYRSGITLDFAVEPWDGDLTPV